MSFIQYLQLGLEHISDLNGYDHILFIVAMCAIYRPSDWRKLLILVTAFTLGHSLTLALAALDVVRVSPSFIEFLIPVTILLTAILNTIPRKGSDATVLDDSLSNDSLLDEMPHKKKSPLKMSFSWNYPVVLFFGLIHGLGFSNYFRMLLGRDGDIVMPLLAFNVGVEAGQLVIVLLFMLLTYVVVGLLKANLRNWTLFVSGAAFGVAVILIKESDWLAG